MLTSVVLSSPMTASAVSTTVEARVASSADDAEEAASGAVGVSSSDLELTIDGSRGEQLVGIRFTSLAMPQGAQITNAYIQFQADEASTDATTLTIESEANDSAQSFGGSFNISARPRNQVAVGWSPAPWDVVGEAGPSQRTPDIAALIQQVIDRPGWAEGNSLAIVIGGTGKRVAESFDGVASAAPLLHVEYDVPMGVTVAATDPVATEGANPEDRGVVRFTRGGPTGESMTILYSVAGSASPDVDYVALLGTATIEPTAEFVDVEIVPIDDADTEGTETVEITILESDYEIGAEIVASVSIIDDETPTVSLVASDAIAIEGASPPNDGEFSVTRSGPTDGALTVVYTVAGDAEADLDYVGLTGSVVIPIGQSLAPIVISALNDEVVENPETVSLTLAGGSGYTVGSPSTASVSIIDDEGQLEIGIAAGSDDSEESSSGSVGLTSSDLEMVSDGSRGDQTIGLRFTGVDVPAGATISAAWLQFQVDEVDTGPASLVIQGEASTQPATFAATNLNISSRPRTAAQATWVPAAWDVVGAAGPDQRSPDLAAIVQELVNSEGWASGNALAFIVTGSGKRVAESFNGAGPIGAPLLHVEFAGVGGPINRAPEVMARAEAVLFGEPANLSGTVTDDSLPDPPAALSYTWTQVSGPGSATIEDATSLETIATFPSPGIYEFKLTAGDGELESSDNVSLAVVDPAAESEVIRFAAFGDYGKGNSNEAAVASLVSSLDPDFIITTGDNRYITDTDFAVGQFYSDYIGNYVGQFGEGSPVNRFFPSIGNHDYHEIGGVAFYLDYFTLPGGGIATSRTSGNERYYDFLQGPVHFFVLNSNDEEPDGRLSTSTQGQWLQAQLAASTSPWQIVYFHHPSYSSGLHGSYPDMQWPFGAWGVDAVLSGHDHTYERLAKGGIPYFVVGTGGAGLYELTSPDPDSQIFYNVDHGTMLVEACATRLAFDFHSLSDGIVDSYNIGASTCTPGATPPVAVEDFATTPEDTAVTVDATANDTDEDGNLDPTTANTSCAACANPSNGAVLDQADGSFLYTPDADYNGSDAFNYQVCDALGSCDVGTVSIEVDPVNDAPLALDDSAVTSANTLVVIDVLSNDSDIDQDTLTVANFTVPGNGEVVDNGDNTLSYTPNTDFTGVDSFDYAAADGTLESNVATVTITISPPNSGQEFEVRVATGNDDAEERSNGSISRNSSDLELVEDGRRGPQTVGMRFTGVAVPAGATITAAYVQFQVDETDTGTINLSIAGEATDSAPGFSTTTFSMSSRDKTLATVAWSPPPWTSVGEAGSDQQTPDLREIIQEIVDRLGWISGNSIALIVSGTGERTAESFNGNQAGAPLLHIEFIPN